MPYDPGHYHRRSIRLKGYDYAQAGAYFVTLCTHERACLLGQVEDGAMLISRIGRLVEQCWRDLPRHFPAVALGPCIIMPNHLHGVLTLSDLGRRGGRGEASAHRLEVTPVPWWADAAPLQSARPTRPHGAQPGSLGAVIQSFKSVSRRKVNQARIAPGAPLWQRNYYERIVRDEDELHRVSEYILGNPANWETDEHNPARRMPGRTTPPW